MGVGCEIINSVRVPGFSGRIFTDNEIFSVLPILASDQRRASFGKKLRSPMMPVNFRPVMRGERTWFFASQAT